MAEEMAQTVINKATSGDFAALFGLSLLGLIGALVAAIIYFYIREKKLERKNDKLFNALLEEEVMNDD